MADSVTKAVLQLKKKKKQKTKTKGKKKKPPQTLCVYVLLFSGKKK